MKSGKSHIERNLEEARRERERTSSTIPFGLSEGGGKGAFVENTNETTTPNRAETEKRATTILAGGGGAFDNREASGEERAGRAAEVAIAGDRAASEEGESELVNEGVLLRASTIKKPADAHTCPTPDITKHELVVGDAWTCKCEQGWIVRPEGYAPNEKGKNKAYGAKWAKRRPRKSPPAAEVSAADGQATSGEGDGIPS